MKYTKKLIILICSFSFASAALGANSILLPLGDSHFLPADPKAEIELSQSGVVGIKEYVDKIEITAQKVGFVHLSLNGQAYKIQTVAKQRLNFYASLKNLLKSKMGLKAELQNGQVLVTGQCHRFEDWLDIISLAKSFRANYIFRAEWDQDLVENVKTHISQQFVKSGMPRPHLEMGPPHRLVLSNQLLGQKQELENLAQAYGLDLHFSHNLLNTDLSVRVHVTVAEVSRRLQKELGIDWPNTLTAQISPRFNSTEQLNATLKALENSGFGQILASPSLVAKSGAEAEFLAGGEFPIKVSSRGAREVHWKRHGIFLKVKPLADSAGRISLDITTEISLIDGATLVDGIPGLKTNRMNTKIDLDAAQTIVLSGLLRKDQHQEDANLPILKSIPILGRFFSNRNALAMNSELIIFLTPEIVQDSKVPDSKMPKGWKPFHDFN